MFPAAVIVLFVAFLEIQEIHCLSDEQKIAIVTTHNDFRKNVKPTAGDMTELEWDNGIAAIAVAWSATCRAAHNPNRGDDVGENLAMSTQPYNTKGAVKKAVKAWYREVKDYDYENNVCAEDRACGHYTQVVDRRSLQIGCATNTAPCDGEWPYILVCNYSPAGNFNGQKPYKSGNKCSNCPDDAKFCSNGFCVDCTGDDCECKRKCQNGGKLDSNSCTCKCNNNNGFYGSFCSDECKNNEPCTQYLTWDNSVVCAKQYFVDECPLKCNPDCENA